MNLLFLGHTEQGVATTARLAASSAMAAGMNVHLYLPEPTQPGDNRQAWLRLVKGKEQITERGPTKDADIVLAFDVAIAKEQLKQMKEKSVIIVNSEEKFTNPLLPKKKIRAYSLDATGLAMESVGKPFPAAPMAGALSKVFPKISLKALRSAIENEFYGQIDQHKAATEQGLRLAK